MSTIAIEIVDKCLVWVLVSRCLQSMKFRKERAAVALMTKEKDTGRVTIDFEHPQSAATPGQIAVFYDGDDVLGSGIIT